MHDASSDVVEVAVDVSNLRKTYGKVVALDGVDLQVSGGTTFGLVGPNGAGKTTLIKALVGSLKPTAGAVKVLGYDPIRERWSLRRQVGYMPQSVALYDDLSARANIMFFSRPQGVKDMASRIDDILTFTELSDRAEDPIRTFSGGMKKRVSLACALVHQPRIIFLDEPTAAVDPHLRYKMWRLFRRLTADGVTLFISTHMMEEALLCDRVAVLRKGVVIADDKPAEILAAGRARLAVKYDGEMQQSVIDASPEALADGLRPFGLSDEVKAVDFQPDSLEDVILSIIESRGES